MDNGRSRIEKNVSTSLAPAVTAAGAPLACPSTTRTPSSLVSVTTVNNAASRGQHASSGVLHYVTADMEPTPSLTLYSISHGNRKERVTETRTSGRRNESESSSERHKPVAEDKKVTLRDSHGRSEMRQSVPTPGAADPSTPPTSSQSSSSTTKFIFGSVKFQDKPRIRHSPETEKSDQCKVHRTSHSGDHRTSPSSIHSSFSSLISDRSLISLTSSADVRPESREGRGSKGSRSRADATFSIMDEFIDDMDNVFSDIIAEEDLKSFRHSMQTPASHSSSVPVTDDERHLHSSPDSATQPDTTITTASTLVGLAHSSTTHVPSQNLPSQRQNHQTEQQSTHKAMLQEPSRREELANKDNSATGWTPVPLAKLDEFSEMSNEGSREESTQDFVYEAESTIIESHQNGHTVLEDTDQDRSGLQDSEIRDSSCKDDGKQDDKTSDGDQWKSARARRSTFRQSRSKRGGAAKTAPVAAVSESGVNGPVGTVRTALCNGEVPTACAEVEEGLDMNSNSKEENLPPPSYCELEKTFLSLGGNRLGLGYQIYSESEDEEDYDTRTRTRVDVDIVGFSNGCKEKGPREHVMLGFAEAYYNSHFLHPTGYHNALSKTVNIVRRKSLNEIVPAEDLLRYTKSSTILSSHVRLFDAENVITACSMFKELHRYVRCDHHHHHLHHHHYRLITSTNSTSGTAATSAVAAATSNSSDLAAGYQQLRLIISSCMQQRELQDELLCQLLRFTGPDNPSDESRHRAWLVMCVASACFRPSVTLRRYLCRYLRRLFEGVDTCLPLSYQHDTRMMSYARYCFHQIRKNKTRAPRRFPPSLTEIEALSSHQPMVCKVQLLNGKSKTIFVDSTDTAGDAVRHMTDKVGLASSDGWALYESVPEQDRYVRDNEYVADLLAEWDERQKALTAATNLAAGTPKKNSSLVVQKASTSQSYGKLILCKRFQPRVTDIGDDPEELKLLFAQAVHNVVHMDEFQATPIMAVHLAGLQAQAEFGDYDDTKKSRYSDLEEFLAQRVLLSDNRNWIREIAASHKRYGKDKLAKDAMLKYLALVSQFPLYGCSKIFAHYLGVWPYGLETILAVNCEGVKIISIQEKKMVADLYYTEMDAISLDKRPRQNYVTFQLKNTVTQGRQKTYLFECLELDDLVALIEFYSPHHAMWLKDTNIISYHQRRVNLKDEIKPPPDWHKLHDNILLCRRILIQTEIVKKPYQEEIGFIRSAINKISGRNCSSMTGRHCVGGLGPSMGGLNDDPEQAGHIEGLNGLDDVSQSGIWSFTKVPFKTSLLAGQTHEMEDVAVRMFNSSLVYTGLEVSATLDDNDLILVIQTLLTKCMENEKLCNEFYLQLIKQTTDTKSESNQKAVLQYWHLMTMASCVMIPANNVIFSYLNFHLRRATLQPHSEEGKFAKFCIRNLKRTYEGGGRKYPPSCKEVMFITKRLPIECRVFLADGHPMLVEFHSASTAKEILQLLKGKAGMRLDAEGFALFQLVHDREDYIKEDEKLADCLYNFERTTRSHSSSSSSNSTSNSSKELKLICKKRLMVEPFVNLNDPVEIDLLYHQSVSDLFDQKIPLTKLDAVQLCALRAQAEYGDYGHANTFDYSDEPIPDEIMYSVVRILPRHLRELMILSEIASVHKTLLGMTPLSANIAFIDILKQWPLFGAVFYEVSQTDLQDLPKSLWLAVSQYGIHLMELRGQSVFLTHGYDDIGECEATNKLLTVNIKSASEAIYFLTMEGNQVVTLINDYREVLAQRRKQGIELSFPLPPEAILTDILEQSSDPDKTVSGSNEKSLSKRDRSNYDHAAVHRPFSYRPQRMNYRNQVALRGRSWAVVANAALRRSRGMTGLGPTAQQIAAIRENLKDKIPLSSKQQPTSPGNFEEKMEGHSNRENPADKWRRAIRTDSNDIRANQRNISDSNRGETSRYSDFNKTGEEISRPDSLAVFSVKGSHSRNVFPNKTIVLSESPENALSGTDWAVREPSSIEELEPGLGYQGGPTFKTAAPISVLHGRYQKVKDGSENAISQRKISSKKASASLSGKEDIVRQ